MNITTTHLSLGAFLFYMAYFFLRVYLLADKV